jgi:arsenite-transporting ATPase
MREYDQVAATIRRDKDLDEDAILNELLYNQGPHQQVVEHLTDKQRRRFFFVLTPEEMIINDTLKAAELFAKFDVPLSGYIVNRSSLRAERAEHTRIISSTASTCRTII